MKHFIGGRKGIPESSSTRERLHAHIGRLERVLEEVTVLGLGHLHVLDGCIKVDVETTGGKDIIDILGSLPNIALDIHGETRSFRDSESEIDGNAAGKAA